jgi:hypothetical protein
MMDAQISQAVSIEIRSILRKGWTLVISDESLLIRGRDGPDFRAEVWRIAQFVAYDGLTCIERISDAPVRYRIESRSRGGLQFEVTVLADEG